MPGAQFASAMSTMATTVSVVTSALGDRREGRTVTALLSLSIDPPAILVSITRDTALAETIADAQAFSVAFLAHDQQPIADSFAGFGMTENRFEKGQWDRWPSGQPRPEGATAAFDCTLAGTIELDTHILFAGIVMHTRTWPDRKPLLWHQRGYAELGPF